MISPWLAALFVIVCIIGPVAIVAASIWRNTLAAPEDFLPRFDTEDEQ